VKEIFQGTLYIKLFSLAARYKNVENIFIPEYIIL
jgi:hypothetical protein